MANLNLSEFTEKLFVADADHTFIWDTANAISKRVSRNSWLSTGSIATSTPLTISQTWTDAAVAFAAMKIVATDTNSAAGSDFLELYSGTATQPLRLDIQKTGQLNIYGTWSNSTSYERLSFSAPTAANAIIGTNQGSGGGTARGLEFQTDGVTRWTINASNGSLIPATASANIGSASSPTGATYLSSVNFYGGANRLADFFGYHPHLGLNASVFIKWESTATITGANDVGIKRNDVGVLEINNGVTAGVFRDLRCRSVIQQLPITTTITPASNGDFIVEATSNTTLTFKLKGTDGTVRSGTITLA